MYRLLHQLARSFVAAGIVLGVAFGLLVASAPAGPLTAGNLVVEQLTGTSGSATAINIQEYTLTGSSVQTISFPSSGSNQQTDSASASSNGYLNSYNGYLSVPGQNLSVGTPSASSSNTKVNSILGTSGTVVSRAVFPTGGASSTPPSPFSGNNYRSSIATSGSTFYAVGTSSGSPTTGGAWYFDGSNFTQLSTAAPTNQRNVEIYSNQLYCSTGSGTTGIYTMGTGLPTTGSQAPTLVPGMTATSPYGFVMFDTNADSILDLAYVADDGSTTGGGLKKFTFSAGTWSNSWSLLVNAGNSLSATAGSGYAGLRGLAGIYQSGTATLFATTTEASNNRLISILDSGAQPSSATGLAAAGVNQVFRGVDVITVPEPTAVTSLGCAAALYAMLRRRRVA
ncbi:MAG: hypothetical protein ACKO4T_01060 [Planctomycetaceae bacterium]